MANYPKSLKYFMWPFQVYFRIGCETSAESLFDRLDRGLMPHVFIIGFLQTPVKGKPSICIDHEDLDYFFDDFNKLKTTKNKILKTDSNRNMMYSGPGMQEEMDERRENEATRKAIEVILTQSKQNTQGYQYFVSKGVSVENYDVHVVVGLVKAVYDSHTHLNKTLYKDNRMKIHRSLLETTIEAYLNNTQKGLYEPNAGKNLSDNSRPAEELLREAARHFMLTIASKGDQISGLHRLFDACNQLSVFSYEGSANYGHLLITEKNNPYLEMTLNLKKSFSVNDHRKTRKLLQLSDRLVGVVSDSKSVFGLGKLKADYPASDESIFNINFLGIHRWNVRHNDKVILQMSYGLPEFPSEAIDKSKFYSDAKRVFQGISTDKIDHLYQLSVTATEQKKGALLVIADDASSEARRLNIQSLSIEPVKLTAELVLNLTSIDGAVLLNTGGEAFAYGLILDGIVAASGDSARGSRYNSAITYYEHRGTAKPTMIIVVSEDGMVDIIPNLRPQIKHSEIIKTIAILKDLSTWPEPDVANFNNLMGHFQKINFYLSAKECREINQLRKKIETALGFQMVRIVYDDLKPNGEMNASFYLNETGTDQVP